MQDDLTQFREYQRKKVQTVDGIETPSPVMRQAWLFKEIDRIKRDFLIWKVACVMGWLSFFALLVTLGFLR